MGKRNLPEATANPVVLSTCPDMGAPGGIANQRVSAGLAACVNSIRGLESAHQWKGAATDDDELLSWIKAAEARCQTPKDAVREAHPYELPEIGCVPILVRLPGYLQWFQDATSPSR